MRLADLQISVQDGAVTARLSGEIDMSNAAELAAAITRMTPNDALGLALDLTDVDYLDSAGVHLMYRLRESLQARGQALRLVIPDSSLVADAMRLAGVTDHIETAATLDEALEAVRGGPV